MIGKRPVISLTIGFNSSEYSAIAIANLIFAEIAFLIFASKYNLAKSFNCADSSGEG